MEVNRWGMAPSLRALGQVSQLVIVAEPFTGRPILSQDQSYISTIWTVRIVETIKGSDRAGSLVRIIVPGGRMTFADGSTAEIRTPGLDPLVPGGRVVFFLEAIESFMPKDLITAETRGSYVPKLGPQGVIRLGADGVHPQGRQTDEIRKLHDRESVDTFLSKLRQVK
jgi:hypothetical protein